MGRKYEFIQDVPYRLAFYAEGDEKGTSHRLILLTRMIVDGVNIPLNTEEEVERAEQDHPWFERVIRRLELIPTKKALYPNGPQLAVNPEVLMALGGEGKSVLQMLSYPLGRCEYEGGLYWYSAKEQVSRHYDFTFEPEQEATGTPEHLSSKFLAELFQGVLELKGNWVMPWRPCSRIPAHVQLTSVDGIQRAEVMVYDGLGYSGLASVALRAQGAMDLHVAFGEAFRQAVDDSICNRSCSLVRVHFDNDEHRDYLGDITGKGHKPAGYDFFGWQPAASRLARSVGSLGSVGTLLAEHISKGYAPEALVIPGVTIEDLNLRPLYK